MSSFPTRSPGSSWSTRTRCFKALSRMSSFPTLSESCEVGGVNGVAFQSAVAHELISNVVSSTPLGSGVSRFQSAVAHELISNMVHLANSCRIVEFQSAVAHELISNTG